MALGLLEVHSFTATLAAIDAAVKAGDVRVVQVELNDLNGTSTRIEGDTASVTAALSAGRMIAEAMKAQVVTQVIANPDRSAARGYVAPREFNPLIEQDVVIEPRYEQTTTTKDRSMSDATQAIGLIETQGFTAVIEAVDTACKAAHVEVVGREKLGGGYITVVIRGDTAAVTAAVEAGKAKVQSLGKLIAAHVIARPSASVLALLPK